MITVQNHFGSYRSRSVSVLRIFQGFSQSRVGILSRFSFVVVVVVVVLVSPVLCVLAGGFRSLGRGNATASVETQISRSETGRCGLVLKTETDRGFLMSMTRRGHSGCEIKRKVRCGAANRPTV